MAVPPHDPGTATGNLPAQLTSLVGRSAALAELAELLERTRLLTLVGPGGCGKSRLAFALAHARRRRFADGAWWVDLAPADPRLVGHLVAVALGEEEPPAGSPAGAVALRLRDRSALLVLDNCEHVADACAGLARDLLGACPGLTILATGRQPLGAPGEQLWRVPGLPVAAPGETGEPGAVELFFERARLAAPSIAQNADTTHAAARICRSLDGMPLAIELAAAKVSILSVEQIADRLEHDIRFLRSTSRTAPARHRSLEATLEWSRRMLAPGEQALLRRLAVFSGSFSLSAAEAVCAGDEVEPSDVIDELARLVDHSLVAVDERSDEPRYRLPETVRQFAAGALTPTEAAELQAKHARFFLELVARPLAGSGDGELDATDRLELEQDNLRAALRTQLAADPPVAGRLAGGLWPFWYRRGAYSEARLWLEQALAVTERMSPGTRALVLTGAGVLAFLQCDYGLANERLRLALELQRELGDRHGIATVLQRLGSIAREQGRYEDARRRHEESRALYEQLGDRDGVAASLDFLGFAAWLSGDFAGAETLSRAALEAFQAGGVRHEIASALINLGATAQYTGDLAGASDRLEHALAVSREIGFQEGIAWAQNQLAIVARRAHHPARAAEPLRESLLVHRRLGDRWRIASMLEEIAGALLARLDPRAAAETLAAAQTLRDALGAPVPPAERRDHDRALSTVRRKLSPNAFAGAWARGAALTLDEAIDATLDAVSRLYGTAPARAPAGAAPLLTGRERAVLELVSQGLTNRQIADRLFISPSTAGVHVSNILRKLGARSRAQAAAAAQRLGLVESASSDDGGRSA